MVVQLADFNSEEAAEQTSVKVQESRSLTADELSQIIDIPVMLAKER